jgi:hypothetical protein
VLQDVKFESLILKEEQIDSFAERSAKENILGVKKEELKGGLRKLYTDTFIIYARLICLV